MCVFMTLSAHALEIIPVQRHGRVVYVLRRDVCLVMDYDARRQYPASIAAFTQTAHAPHVSLTTCLPCFALVELLRVFLHDPNKKRETALAIPLVIFVSLHHITDRLSFLIHFSDKCLTARYFSLYTALGE